MLRNERAARSYAFPSATRGPCADPDGVASPRPGLRRRCDARSAAWGSRSARRDRRSRRRHGKPCSRGGGPKERNRVRSLADVRHRRARLAIPYPSLPQPTTVIASAAKQSRNLHARMLDCFVAVFLAMTQGSRGEELLTRPAAKLSRSRCPPEAQALFAIPHPGIRFPLSAIEQPSARPADKDGF
jgi:hypothetical protein